jgi:hypothetical protein
MNYRRIGTMLLVVFGILFGTVTAYALTGPHLTEFQDFIKNLREEKRVDRLGYLVFVRLPVTKSSEDRLLMHAGKFFYACEDGYLTHVNFARLDRLAKAKITVSILDKKRLDDTQEGWYLVWVENPEELARLKERYEPLYHHDKTAVVRIRCEDEAFLQNNKFEYSLLEESLLPLRVQPTGKFSKKKVKDPLIEQMVAAVNGAALASSVQILQNFQTRYVRENGNAEASAWLKSEFEKIGSLEVSTPEFSPGYPGKTNVVAVKRGEKDPDSVYVVCAHMDSTVSTYDKKRAPGADDNGSGSAAVLELARVLGSLRFPETIIFACWNGEEIGLVGSKAYAQVLAAENKLKVKAVFNMDMIADRDDNNVAVIGNTRSNWLIDVFKNAAELYTGLQSTTLYNSNIWYSDHSAFWNIGASAILTIEGYPEMSAHYHSVRDLLENMSVTFMERIARSNLAALLTLNPPTQELPQR